MPEECVEKATTARIKLGEAGVTGYGYMWWITDIAGQPGYPANGVGGQGIHVLPAHDLVLAVATEYDDRDPARMTKMFSRKPVISMVENAIVPHPPNYHAVQSPSGQRAVVTHHQPPRCGVFRAEWLWWRQATATARHRPAKRVREWHGAHEQRGALGAPAVIPRLGSEPRPDRHRVATDPQDHGHIGSDQSRRGHDMPDSHSRRRIAIVGRTRSVTVQQRTRAAASTLTATVLMILATSACTSTASRDDAQVTAAVSSSSASVSGTHSAAATTVAAATTEGTFELAGGATVGILAAPWTEAARRDGQLLQMLPGAPGTSFDEKVWGDIIIYVPDAAYGAGTTRPEPVPADPVAWTTSHANLEILDQREITVDGVAATQIDARATTETNWLAVQAKPYEWGGTERVVLIPLTGSWLVVRGSAFKEDIAFAEEPAPGDAFAAVLDSVDLTG